MLTQSNQNEDVIHLKPPVLNPSQIIGNVAALRPFRIGKEKFGREIKYNKQIYHNYGHGKWGVNLSYGSADKLINQFEKDNGTHPKEVTVVGAGYVGLFTAYLLLQKGHKVTIIAKLIPKKDYKKFNSNKQMVEELITSQVSLGLVIRWDSKQFQCTDFDQQVVNKSHSFFLQSIQNNLFKGLKYRDFYDFRSEDKFFASQGFQNEGKWVKVDFGNGKQTRAYTFKAIIVDAEFILDLYTKVQNMGAKIQQKMINNIVEIRDDIVFNCSGIGAYKLVDDKKVFSQKGQLIYFKPQPQIDYCFYAESSITGLSFIPNDDKILVGGNPEDNNWDPHPKPETQEQILSSILEFFDDKILKPKL